MADPIVDPAPPTAAELNLNYARQTTGERLITYLNGVTFNVLSRYPQAEVQSWTIQRREALEILAAGEAATPEMASLITKVCEFHHGEATAEVRLEQVKVKAAEVIANAEAWETAAAFVNGLRARTEDELAAAESSDECLVIIQGAMAQADAFRQAAGI